MSNIIQNNYRTLSEVEKMIEEEFGFTPIIQHFSINYDDRISGSMISIDISSYGFASAKRKLDAGEVTSAAVENSDG